MPPKFCDDRVRIYQGDATCIAPDFWQTQLPSGAFFSSVLSDMCHDTQGREDASKSLDLCHTAWEVATGARGTGGVLEVGGCLVMKVLQGQGTQEFGKALQRDFSEVVYVRPKVGCPFEHRHEMPPAMPYLPKYRLTSRGIRRPLARKASRSTSWALGGRNNQTEPISYLVFGAAIHDATPLTCKNSSSTSTNSTPSGAPPCAASHVLNACHCQ